jgi:hypothetical protein
MFFIKLKFRKGNTQDMLLETGSIIFKRDKGLTFHGSRYSADGVIKWIVAAHGGDIMIPPCVFRLNGKLFSWCKFVYWVM